MPFLARAKRRVAVRLNSNALQSDSHQSDIFAYLSVILLLGSHSTPFWAGAGEIQLPLLACCQSSSAKALPAGVAKPVRTRIFEMEQVAQRPFPGNCERSCRID